MPVAPVTASRCPVKGCEWSWVCGPEPLPLYVVAALIIFDYQMAAVHVLDGCVTNQMLGN